MGLVPGAGGTASIVGRIGRHRTAFMALAAQAVAAPMALEWGLVDAVPALPGIGEEPLPAERSGRQGRQRGDGVDGDRTVLVEETGVDHARPATSGDEVAPRSNSDRRWREVFEPHTGRRQPHRGGDVQRTVHRGDSDQVGRRYR